MFLGVPKRALREPDLSFVVQVLVLRVQYWCMTYKTMYSSKVKLGIPIVRVVPKSVQHMNKLALNEHLIVYSKYRFCHCT